MRAAFVIRRLAFTIDDVRVLQISSAKNFGGGERHLADLCAGLKKREHEIFAALRAKNLWREKLSCLPEENILYAPLRNSFDFLSARTIARFAKEKNVRIIHAHLARDYPVAALAARLSRVNLVLTRHLLFPLNFSHKIILPKNTVFIAVSNSVRQQISKQRILPSEQIRLVYNGVGARRFNDEEKQANKNNLTAPLNVSGDCLLVGTVGEIATHKGQMDFVRAAAEVAKKFPGAQFLIAGRDASPQKKHEKNLRNLIADFGLENKIHLLGWLENTAPFLSALDVFVSTSHFESFGLATVEALAAGCAVVATETDGAIETIDDGATGKLVPIKNSRSLAGAIIELLSDEQTRKKLGANAAAAAAKRFSLERMIAETEKIYRDLLKAQSK